MANEEVKVDQAQPNPKKTDKKQPSESSENESDKKIVLANVRKIFWVAIAILVVLLILSIAVLAARMYKYAKLAEEGRVINISADSVEDFEIFSAEYQNDSGETIIKSADGMPVIAPGASTEYTIRIKNKDDVAIDYEFNPKVEYSGVSGFPIEVRLISPNEEYLIGSAKSWGTFDDFNGFKFSSTLPVGEIDEYELQWRWLFDNGNDEEDTALGNSEEGAATIKVGMSLSSEANLSAEANGGFFKVGTEDTLRIWIFLILLLIVIILLIISVLRRKEKEAEPVVVYVPTASAPEPVVTATPKQREKDKGFVGKMEYINIDTLVDAFNSGDKINLRVLKEKGLINPNTTQMKILARNDMVLEKAFHIETQGISAQAKQKVIAAGGSVKIVDG